jgi:hypothetical protein
MKPYKAYVVQEQDRVLRDNQPWGDVMGFNSKRKAVEAAKSKHREYWHCWNHRVIERTESVVWEGEV